MFVIFVAPIFSPAATQMLEALLMLSGVRVGVVSHQTVDRLAPTMARTVAHWRVDDITDAAKLERAVRALAESHGPVARCFGAYEQAQLPLAIVRERLGIRGLPSAAAARFRDKALMKDVLRAAGIPVARHQLVKSRDDARRFATLVGFPLVMKPPAGAGARATARIGTLAMLEASLAAHEPSAARPMLAEEFLRGTEHSLETVSINGRAVWHSITHYDPTPLAVIEQPWVQWTVLLPREVDEPRFEDIRTLGARALEALGMDTGVSHAEWFRRADGTLAISEIAARPPGAQITTMVSRAHDVDFVRAWVELMVFGTFTASPRRYAVATAYLRGQGEGRVIRIDGLDAVQRDFGSMICDVRLPTVGQTPTGSYEGEGFIVVRHPDTAVAKLAVQRIVSTVRVRLG